MAEHSIPREMTKWRWFWPWQDDLEEAWLRETSLGGWHLVSASIPGVYRFVSGEPVDYVYRLDYRKDLARRRAEYMQLFRDAGWEYVTQMNYWLYFRKPALAGGADEIFTDNASKVQKYRRVLAGLSAFQPIWITWYILFGNMSRRNGGLAWPVLAILVAVMALLAYCTIRIRLRMHQLGRR
jgi:hypothetical protein